MDEKKKRKVTFNVEMNDDISAKKTKNIPPATTTTTTDSAEGESRLHRGKYALDSDEEDEEEIEERKRLNEDEMDGEEIGQEQATIGFDEDVKITPFNIDEELEEGHYDESGCFQWKKKNKEDIHDAWLDEIDWTNVKNYKFRNESAKAKEKEQEEETKEFDERSTLEAMLKIMEPGETVTRTIKRLGASIAKTPKGKGKGQEKVRRLLPGEVAPVVPSTINSTDDDSKKNEDLFNEMSGLADLFVSNGDLDIYQETFERLKSKFDRLQSTSTLKDAQFDMYGDDDVSSSVRSTHSSSSTKEIRWEYLTNEDDLTSLQGPFTTEQMIRLSQTEGKLDADKVRCRRLGTEQFYSIKRIDFDLYLD